MKNNHLTGRISLIALTVVLLSIGFVSFMFYERSVEFGFPPYFADGPDLELYPSDPNEYANWQRPEGPIKIGLQVGHWKTEEMPEEQERIKDSGGGTSSRGLAEWEVILAIAEKTSEILTEKGYEVDILPSTIPEGYWADAFVSIHADGNLNPTVKGYKVAAYQRDRTNNAEALSDLVSQKYGETTGFPLDPNITAGMTRYYAFNSRRYKHAVHPMTPSILIETGFMTNYNEASILINKPEIPAQGIAEGIIAFIEN